MEIYELRVLIRLKTQLSFSQIPEFLSKNINRSFLEDRDLKELHLKNNIKPYCVDFLRHEGARKDKFEAKDKLFFTIRSINDEILNKIRLCLEISRGLEFAVLGTKITSFKPGIINSLYTMSPAVVTISIENKATCWTKECGDVVALKASIETNLKNKFALYGGELKNSVPNDEIIDLIEIKTHKAFAFTYKRGRIFAYRYQIHFASNHFAQNLAKIALALGVGEKGSLAFGFARIGKDNNDT